MLIEQKMRSIIANCMYNYTDTSSASVNRLQVQDKDGLYGVLMVAPSVTPYGHMNPSFRVFSMNRSSHQLLGYHQYHLNLTKANGELYTSACDVLHVLAPFLF